MKRGREIVLALVFKKVEIIYKLKCSNTATVTIFKTAEYNIGVRASCNEAKFNRHGRLVAQSSIANGKLSTYVFKRKRGIWDIKHINKVTSSLAGNTKCKSKVATYTVAGVPTWNWW